MPRRPNACYGCYEWHSTCEPTFITEPDGRTRKTDCLLCKHRQIECVYPQPALPLQSSKAKKTKPGRSDPDRPQLQAKTSSSSSSSLTKKQQEFPSFTTNARRRLQGKAKGKGKGKEREHRHRSSAQDGEYSGERNRAAGNKNENLKMRGWQDWNSMSKENGLRRHVRQGALVFDLMKSVIRGAHTGLFCEYPASRANDFAITNLMTSFDTNGFHLRGDGLGPLGEANLALLCAIGSLMTSHSEVIGGHPSQLPSLPSSWISSDISSFGSPKSHSPISSAPDSNSSSNSQNQTQSSTEDLDLRQYGLGRQKIQRHLWQFCWETFERNGLFRDDGDNNSSGDNDEGRSGNNYRDPREILRNPVEELKLLSLFHYFSGISSTLTRAQSKFLESRNLKRIRSIPVSSNGGWSTRHDLVDHLETFIAGNSQIWVANSELPPITDDDILNNLDDPTIPARMILSFDRKTIPPIFDLDSHYRIVRRTYLSVERMMAVTAHELPNITDIEAEHVLIRMYSILQDRESWRTSTILPNHQKPQTLDSEEWFHMTPFGPENPRITRLDFFSRTLCHCKMLNLVNERLSRMATDTSSSPSELYELRERCASDVDSFIRRMEEIISKENGSVALRDRSRALLVLGSCLPGGISYLVEYLKRQKDFQDFNERALNVSRIWSYCKQLSFTGQKALWQLFELETALAVKFDGFVGDSGSGTLAPNNSTSDVANIIGSPDSSDEPIEPPVKMLVDRMLIDALREIGVA